MGKKNTLDDMLLGLGTSDDSDDEGGETSGEKKSRIGGKVGAYMRIKSLINNYISRQEEEGNDNTADVLRNLLKEVEVCQESTGVPGAMKHYVGQLPDGTLEAFDSASVPTSATFSQYERVFGNYRKATISHRLANGIPEEEMSHKLVFSTRRAA
jgi:hypothetical protein